ncbi:TonB family protein [Burkholderiaceae bacterium DAT-1]|nr:TonB family protein [Burkholderiaceae bacterium DAT-1]
MTNLTDIPLDAGIRDRAAERRFLTIVVASVLAHVLVIVGVRFAPPELNTLFNSIPLEVVLVNASTKHPTNQPKVLAQANLDGGGNTDEANRRLSSPLPPEQVESVSDRLSRASQRQAELEAKQQQLLNQLDSNFQAVQQQVKQEKKEVREQKKTDSQDEENREIARLLAEIKQQTDAYQSKPRMAFLAANARNKVEAKYLDEWRVQVERIGNAHFPMDARGKKLFGRLIVEVQIKADGTLAAFRVDTGSGNRDLDKAAEKIARLAAPFKQLPSTIVDMNGKPADILSITRTWTFSNGNGEFKDSAGR